MRGTLAFILAILMIVPAFGAPSSGAAAKPVDLIVDLDTTSLEAVRSAADETGTTIASVDEVLGSALVRAPDPAAFRAELGAPAPEDPVPELLVDALAADVPADPYYAAQWALRHMNMEQAWAVETGSRSVRVAVIDTGIDWGHSEFSLQWVDLGHDYVDGDDEPKDVHGHGTFTAGIVGAQRDNLAGVSGMARPTLHILRVLDGFGAGSCYALGLAIVEAVDAGDDIINISLSCPSWVSSIGDAVSYARDNGVLVVASAGNDQETNPSSCVHFPASHPDAVAVGATQAYPPTGPALYTFPADYSCRGPEVEIAAPGSYIFSTTVGGYALGSGTSASAPYVAGAAALLEAQDPSRDGDAIRSILKQTANDVGPSGNDHATGHGEIDPLEALTGDEDVHIPT